MNYSIRRWKSTDLPVLMNYMNNIHIWSKLTCDSPLPFTEADAKSYISPEDSLTELTYAIVVNEDIVGGAKLTAGEAPNNIVYRMDLWLDPELWFDKGLVNVIKDLGQFTFFHLPAIKLVVNALGSDVEFHKLLKDAGFEEEAVMKRAILKSGNIEDLHYFSMTEK